MAEPIIIFSDRKSPKVNEKFHSVPIYYKTHIPKSIPDQFY